MQGSQFMRNNITLRGLNIVGISLFLQKAVGNALRYFPVDFHDQLAPEFAKELEDFGHIYMYRYLPSFPLR